MMTQPQRCIRHSIQYYKRIRGQPKTYQWVTCWKPLCWATVTMTQEHYRATRCPNSGPQCPSSTVNPGEPQNAPRDVSAEWALIWVVVGKSPDPLGCLRSKGLLRSHGRYMSRGKTMRPSCYIIDQSIILGGTDDENPPTQRVNQAVPPTSFAWIERSLTWIRYKNYYRYVYFNLLEIWSSLPSRLVWRERSRLVFRKCLLWISTGTTGNLVPIENGYTDVFWTLQKENSWSVLGNFPEHYTVTSN